MLQNQAEQTEAHIKKEFEQLCQFLRDEEAGQDNCSEGGRGAEEEAVRRADDEN